MLPVATWQIAYLASPLLHYNTDSSNATVCIGNESKDSPYYYFAPEELLHQLIDLLSGFVSMGPEVLGQIQTLKDELLTQLTANAGEVPAAVSGVVDDVITRVNAVFTKLMDWVNVLDGGDGVEEGESLAVALTDLNAAVDIQGLTDVMTPFFEPLRTFIDSVVEIMGEAASSVVADLAALLGAAFENSDVLSFDWAEGIQGNLPVSFNVIAIRPGVTFNMNVCLQRKDEALDRWRLETFGTLYQAYLQQVAEYESQSYQGSLPRGLQKSPGTLRGEERRALKEIVLHSLNNVKDDNGNHYTLERLNLLENAVDWENMSFKLHQYGPNKNSVLLEKGGLLAGADARRRAFLTSHWAQVLIPLQPQEHLELQFLSYVESGEADLEGELGDDQLAALYQDLVLDRMETDEDGPGEWRDEILPTDLIVLKTPQLESELPVNTAELEADD